MKRLITSVVITFALAVGLFSNPVLAADAMQYYKGIIKKVMKGAQEGFRPAMSSDERAIENTIHLKVTTSHGVGAFATISASGRREIRISSGMAQILEWLGTAALLDQEFGRHGCLLSYSTELFQAIAENSRRKAQGRRLIGVAAPFEFRGKCGGVSKSRFLQSEHGGVFAAMMDASMAFLYLHETAHHVLGHVDAQPHSRSMSRQQEAEADAWAAQVAREARFNLAIGYPMLALMAGLGGDSIEAELLSTHPLGVRRVRAMLLAAREQATNSDVREYVDDMLYELRNFPGVGGE